MDSPTVSPAAYERSVLLFHPQPIPGLSCVAANESTPFGHNSRSSRVLSTPEARIKLYPYTCEERLSFESFLAVMLDVLSTIGVFLSHASVRGESVSFTARESSVMRMRDPTLDHPDLISMRIQSDSGFSRR